MDDIAVAEAVSACLVTQLVTPSQQVFPATQYAALVGQGNVIIYFAFPEHTSVDLAV